MEGNVDQLKAYSESCNSMRHYSNAMLTLRITTVVQGVALLSAWMYMQIKENLSGIPVSIIGLFFTFF